MKRDRSRAIYVAGVVAVGIMGILTLAAFALAPSSQAAARPSVTPSSVTHGSLTGPTVRLVKSNAGAVTQSDVIRYVQAVGMPRTLNATSPFTVTHAELLTSLAISARLHGEQTGYPNNATLWFVQMHGTFVFPGPGGHTVTSHIGYQVFDPTTGNLVMFGGMG